MGREDGVGGWVGGSVGGDELHLTLNCCHQNDFCIKMGSDETRLTFH